MGDVKQRKNGRRTPLFHFGAALVVTGLAALLGGVAATTDSSDPYECSHGDVCGGGDPTLRPEPSSTGGESSPPVATTNPATGQPSSVPQAQPPFIINIPPQEEKKKDGDESIAAIISAAGGAVGTILGGVAMLIAVKRQPAAGVPVPTPGAAVGSSSLPSPSGQPDPAGTPDPSGQS
ncbi:hypothetical protein [Streptomyces mexicanus]|jgi:hypothetical protein|uniref:hypothetical protein n=1 Tax=Streptomyces mexicanus TaxID=178566 RepID=UPI0031E8819B